MVEVQFLRNITYFWVFVYGAPDLERNLSRIGDVTEYRFQQGGFTGAVWTDNGQDFLAVGMQVNVFQD